MSHNWRVGQDAFVVYGGGKATYAATITKVGRKYGDATWGDGIWQETCEFVLETGLSRDEHNSHANYRGHI